MANLLFVDDELSIRNLCYDYFTKHGHMVFTSARGPEAVTLLEKEKIDLVLMDLQMPGESGLSLLKKMRATNSQAAVIVFSGMITPEVEKEAYANGVAEVITKGSAITLVRDKIEKVLSAKDSLSAGSVQDRLDKVLVVDDDDGIRNLLVAFFRRKNIHVLSASNGEEAVKLVQKENPSVVLLDINMPGMDGLLTLKKIREINPELGVVMASGVHDEQIIKEAMSLGAYHYVTKPFDLKYLDLVVLTRLALAL